MRGGPPPPPGLPRARALPAAPHLRAGPGDLADAVRYFWGADNKTGPAAPGLAGSVPHRGSALPLLRPRRHRSSAPWSPSVSGSLFHRTRWGVLIRAATQDREMVGGARSRPVGISSRASSCSARSSRAGRGAPGAAPRPHHRHGHHRHRRGLRGRGDRRHGLGVGRAPRLAPHRGAQRLRRARPPRRPPSCSCSW